MDYNYGYLPCFVGLSYSYLLGCVVAIAQLYGIALFVWQSSHVRDIFIVQDELEKIVRLVIVA